MWLRKPGIHILETEACFTPYTKINSNRVKDRSIRPKILKFLEENLRKHFMTLNLTRLSWI
jgi:hypothetical protein